MFEEMSHLALSLTRFPGDPLMVGALLAGMLLCCSLGILVALWRLSHRILHVLKNQKEIKTLITGTLISARGTSYAEEPTASMPVPQEAAPAVSLPNSSTAEDVQQEEAPPRTIVQTYRAGKSLYLLYSDGSVEADTDGHIQTFSSIHLLKEAMARKNQSTQLRSAS